MATSTGTMEVTVPKGLKPGQVMTANSPEGIPVQVEIPKGLKAGSKFYVEYPIASAQTATSAGSERICGFKIRDIILVICLILLAIYATSEGDEYHSGEKTMVVEKRTFSHHVKSHSIILVLVVAAVIYDWKTLGPTLALQHGVIAGVVAWLFVVPLAAFLGSFSSILFLTLAIMAFFVFTFTLGPPGCAVGILILCAVSVLMSMVPYLLHGTLGTVLFFAITFFALRSFSGTVAPQMQKVDSWPHLTQILPGSREFQEQVDYFMACCVPWEHMFDFALTVQNLYRIDRPGAVIARMPVGDSDGTRLLFHGTGWESAKAIICDGWKMPTQAGMFGKGLYFADCPLKSWRYCFPSQQMSAFVPRVTGRGGLILMCRVELGEIREEKEAAPALSGYKREGWRAWLTGGRGAYDSVKGVDHEEGGALRVPEYVVYRPEQAHLAYMFEVRTAKKVQTRGASSSSQVQNPQE